ncbi:MAG: anti-sigma factor antagonist [Ethanoligenens sp.]|uniref:STAS domain-containing protein n=1 Tax=Ethanoligenens sp. TaxID=2099655 RepID=UPI0039ED162F
MALKMENDAHVLTVYLDGEIDHHAARGIREEIDTSIERVHPDALALDFRGVTFMDSSGIGLVMGRYRAMQPFGGIVTVKNASMHIRKVMRLAGLDKLAHIE